MQAVQKEAIKRSVTELIVRLATELSMHPEAVADVAFLHIQKHPSWGRNPTKAQKRTAHRHWKGRCQHCQEQVPFEAAVFHHLRRRIPKQHQPDNLLPYHASCHDSEHEAQRGSLSKGSPTQKVRE